MLPATIDLIAESDLDSLVTGGVRESRSIEFKAALTIGSDSEKREFLADVSSFANATGKLGVSNCLSWQGKKRDFLIGGWRGG